MLTVRKVGIFFFLFCSKYSENCRLKPELKNSFVFINTGINAQRAYQRMVDYE